MKLHEWFQVNTTDNMIIVFAVDKDDARKKVRRMEKCKMKDIQSVTVWERPVKLSVPKKVLVSMVI